MWSTGEPPLRIPLEDDRARHRPKAMRRRHSGRQQSANTGHSPTAWRTGQYDPKATFAQASGECRGRVQHDAHHTYRYG